MKLNNKYYILRHGEAVSNVKNICSSWPETFENPLTQKGREVIMEDVEKLKGKHVDLIFASDLLRTKQTAEIVAQQLNLEVKFDKRLREVGFGVLNGKPAEELLYLSFEKERLNKSFQKSETYESVLKRVSNFLEDVDNKYKGKNILIVSHQCPLWILENYVKGISLLDSLQKNPEEKRITRGELRELN